MSLVRAAGRLVWFDMTQAIEVVFVAVAVNQSKRSIQRHLRAETRLGVPAVIHEEICSGLMARDATAYPQALGPVNFYLSEAMFKMFIGVYLIMVFDPQILFNDGFYPLLHVVILAIVQGITEFLPISSSGHLVLVPVFADWPDQGLTIDKKQTVSVGDSLTIKDWFDDTRRVEWFRSVGPGNTSVPAAR